MLISIRSVIVRSNVRPEASGNDAALHSCRQLPLYALAALMVFGLNQPRAAQNMSKRAVQDQIAVRRDARPPAGFMSVMPAARTNLGSSGSQLPYQYHYAAIAIPAASEQEPRLERFSQKLAMEYVEQGARAWTMQYHCVSCHTNGSYMLIRPMLASSIGRPRTEIRNFFVSTLLQ